MARFGHGTLITWPVEGEVEGCGDINFEPPTPGRVAVPNQSSTSGHVEHMLTLFDGGVVSTKIAYDPDDGVHQAIELAHGTLVEGITLTIPGSVPVTKTFDAHVTVKITGSENAPMWMDLKLLIEGEVV